jgi:septal ring factor EnvC (AmiA/AmiB activator)
MDPKPSFFESKSKIAKVAGLPKLIEALKKLLRRSQVGIIEAAANIIEDNTTLQEQIKDTNHFKIEISSKFENVKKSLINTENSINNITEEKSDLEFELQKWKEQFSQMDKQHSEIKQEYERFLWDVLFSLETTKKRFEGHELVSKNIQETHSAVMTKIKHELEYPDNEKSLSRSDRKTGVIKYIGIFTDMLSIFKEEMTKSQDLCDIIPDLKNQIKQLKEESKQKDLKNNIEKEEAQINYDEDFELKNQEITDMSQSYQNQIILIQDQLNHYKEETKSKDHEINSLNQESASLSKNLTSQIDFCQILKNTTLAAIDKYECLKFQKKVMITQYEELNQMHIKTSGFLERVYCKVRELNLDSLNDESFINEHKFNDQTFNPFRCFRKAVIAVIALNRMIRLTGNAQGFGKYNFEEIDNIEIIPGQNLSNEQILINESCHNYLDTDDNLKSFKNQTSIDGSFAVTPIKHRPNESVSKNLFMKPSNIHLSFAQKSTQNFRRMHPIDYFPYINLKNHKLTAISNKCNKSPFYTALTRQLDLQLKSFFERMKNYKQT